MKFTSPTVRVCFACRRKDVYLCSSVCTAALNRLASDQRRNVYNILDNHKVTLPQKRSLLGKLGLARTTVDEFELLLQVGRYIMLDSTHCDLKFL